MRARVSGMLSKAKDKVGVLKHSSSKNSLSAADGDDHTHTARLDTMFFASPDDRQIAVDKTYGLVKLTLKEAELPEAGQYFAAVSIGQQNFSSTTSEATTLPKWDAGRNLVLQRGDATLARIAVYQVTRRTKTRRKKQSLVAYCDMDLASHFQGPTAAEDASAAGPDAKQPPAPIEAWHDLQDPSDSTVKMGRVHLSVESATLANLEQQFWGRVLTIADLDGDGELSSEEFIMLMDAFGSDLTREQTEELYRRADKNNSNSVNEEELANCLAASHADGELSKLIKRCPVSGATLVPGDDWGNIIYMTLCMDQGSGNGLQGTSGATDSAQWMLKMSEWAPGTASGTLTAATESKWDPNAGAERKGANASHIVVYDRASKRLVEETISPHLILAMRQIYQSRVGLVMMRTGALNTLELMSKDQGRHMDSPESVKTIQSFLKEFGGDVDVSEAAEPVESYKTFNEFFYRKLKPGARPIAHPELPDVMVSAADCRLAAFTSVSDATRCWIKGKKFSIKGLLSDPEDLLAPTFDGGSMVIFRLAPQDYHRFHFPVSGTLKSVTDVRGKLYTVNPIAVNSTFANVFTQNKRAVVIIDSPQFGEVAFIAIGATMVGSINFTAEVGKTYAKGDEMGYFAFGGSTTIALFQKDAVVIDADLLSNSLRSLETLVKVGERLGVAPTSQLRHSTSMQVASLAELETHVGHIVPIDQALEALDRQAGKDGMSATPHTAVPLSASPRLSSTSDTLPDEDNSTEESDDEPEP